MKTFILATVALFISQAALATDKYTEAMQKNIQVVYTADTIPALQSAVNGFERIAAVEKTKWEPYYYAAFGYVMMSNIEKDAAKKDAFLDQATTALGKAKEIVADESEVVAMEGFIYMMRLTVDPASRGQKYAGLSMQSFNKAVALNPNNPRALALLAQMQFGSAQFFGSSTDEACATAKGALEKFATYKSDNVLAPQWGRSMAERLQNSCVEKK